MVAPRGRPACRIGLIALNRVFSSFGRRLGAAPNVLRVGGGFGDRRSGVANAWGGSQATERHFDFPSMMAFSCGLPEKSL